MTPQEQQLLMQLTQRINQTQLQEKDPDAENLLGRELGANPDAIYILAQTVLVQNIALEQARAQVNQLQQQLQQAQQAPQQPAHATSFLGRLLGEREESAAPPPPQYPQTQQTPPYQPVPQPPYPPPPQYQQAQFSAPPPGQPSFLRGAVQTAAGVAAGALAFEGVESLLHGFGHVGYGPGFGMGGFGMGPGMGMMGGFERPVEETVVNNYYDQPGPSGGGEHRVETGGNEPQFSDTSYNTSGNDFSGNQSNGDANLVDTSYDNSADDVQFDDSGQEEDTGGFDDGGGFDDSGNDLV